MTNQTCSSDKSRFVVWHPILPVWVVVVWLGSWIGLLDILRSERVAQLSADELSLRQVAAGIFLAAAAFIGPALVWGLSIRITVTDSDLECSRLFGAIKHRYQVEEIASVQTKSSNGQKGPIPHIFVAFKDGRKLRIDAYAKNFQRFEEWVQTAKR